MNEQLHQAII